MLYINQNGYPHVPYPTNLQKPNSREATLGGIESSGCGLCACMMAVDRVTISSLNLEEARDLAIACKANMEPGTDMRIYGPVVAQKFGMTITESNSEEELKNCLKAGGAAVIRVAGDNEKTGHRGIFCYLDHYIVAISYDEVSKEFCILDPAYRLGKYDGPGKAKKIRDGGVFLYATEQVIREDTDETEARYPRYYLFRRQTDRQ